MKDVFFILKHLKDETNEARDENNEFVTKRIGLILQTNTSLRHVVTTCLTEKNPRIIPDEFPLIRDIIFRYYNEFILYQINWEQYLIRMLTHQKKQNIEYFMVWFQHFLCQPNPSWIKYQVLLREWTNALFYKQDSFPKVIKQIDMLTEIWTKVAPEDRQRSDFFILHMASQCFRQGNDHRFQSIQVL